LIVKQNLFVGTVDPAMGAMVAPFFSLYISKPPTLQALPGGHGVGWRLDGSIKDVVASVPAVCYMLDKSITFKKDPNKVECPNPT